MGMHSNLALYLYAFALIATIKSSNSSPLAIQLSFSAIVEQSWVEHTDDPSPPTHTKASVASSEALLAFRQETPLTDGRRDEELSLFGKQHQYHFQPFFDERVCFKFDLPLGQTTNSAAAWKSVVFHAMGIYEDLLSLVELEGNATVDGRPCECWFYTAGDPKDPSSTVIVYRLYVDAQRALLAVNLTNAYPGYLSVTTTSFKHFSHNPPPSVFAPEQTCVDLTSGRNISALSLVNDVESISLANIEADGVWHSAASSVFEGVTLEAAQHRLGTEVKPIHLPLKEDGARLTAFSPRGIPHAFDARDQWKKCPSIQAIRNQGDCGSCWAFAANEVLADRLCIDGVDPNFTGSVEYMIDCDTKDNGCGGGLLDDAWTFLKDVGVPAEACDTYKHCPHPEFEKCGINSTHAALHDAPICPTACHDGSAPHRRQASTAYAVATPGNVTAMQLEILSHGPIEVSFFVFSDFLTYTNGTYFRTPSATGPQGGHAVKMLGWGVDSMGIDYWLIANSWSAAWGEHGFFRIRRGTNECGIETTPVAGLVSGSIAASDGLAIFV